MRNPLSRASVFISVLVLMLFRFWIVTPGKEKPMRVITWDAFGYYLPLPAI